ncbi:MAG: metal ABC transporter ATP-binding protein [Bacteroidales bacterium]|nr:metal ABC transporter ATP-binding protein [Bacteroidales bacterium]
MNEMGNELIKLSGISMRWDAKEVLSGINMTVERGDFLAITGPNGGGKSTLLRVILKLLSPTSGSVEYFDTAGNLTERLPIGYLPQKNMIDSRFPITVREVVSSGLLGKSGVKNGCASGKDIVDETLRLIELHSHADAPIGVLSGGQLQRALLGRAIISSPEVLVLDEPLSYLDKHFEEHIYSILRDLSASATILLVSHEMSVISTMATRHLIVDHTLHECRARHHYVASECD